jgi:hypothetical protein
MGAGQQSHEGRDRDNLLWDNVTHQAADFVASIKHPGKKIVHLVSSGASVIDFDKTFDSIMYSTMPGEGFADALVSMIYGRARPSAKLTVTMPNK